MKRIVSALAALLCAGAIAFALNITNSPIVGPTETGEWSAMSQQVVDVARFKPGMTVATAGGSVAAATTTVNTAAAQITWPGNITIVSGATATLTCTCSKAQAGDIVLASLSFTNTPTSGSAPAFVNTSVTNGQLVFTITNLTATSVAQTPVITWLLMTTGNPN